MTSWFFVGKGQTRRSSARARSYISGYYNLHYNNGSLLQTNEQVLTEDGVPGLDVVNVEGDAAIVVAGGGTPTDPWIPADGEVLSMHLIEKAKKEYHSHRGVNSFEKGTHTG